MLASISIRDVATTESHLTRQAAAPFAFDLVEWEVRQVAARLGTLIEALRGRQLAATSADLATTRAYFALPAAARLGQRSEAEQAIERLVTEAWVDEGLAGSTVLSPQQPTLFPPVSFTFTAPPQVLIVSPRNQIKVIQYALLRPELGLDQVQQLEESVARRGYSTLVTPIGGLATYPAMVLDGGSAASTLAAVAHEWVHAYFFFHPIGRGYWSDQEVRTINETAAELAGNELGRRLAGALDLPGTPPTRTPDTRQAEFNRLMRETRLEVDRLLAAGQIEAAERYMGQRRLELNARGFAIRRLNQAYFAFHGSYAEGPAGSSPIAGQVRRLRTRSDSLGDFLRTIAQVSNADDLARLDARS